MQSLQGVLKVIINWFFNFDENASVGYFNTHNILIPVPMLEEYLFKKWNQYFDQAINQDKLINEKVQFANKIQNRINYYQSLINENKTEELKAEFTRLKSELALETDKLENLKAAAKKFASQEKDVAIAASVATAIAIAYWAGAWFFGLTIPDAIAATASAVATTVAMGLMWGSYDASTKLEADIEHGVSNWLYYLNDTYAIGRLVQTGINFKTLIAPRFTYNINFANGVVTAEMTTVDATLWAVPVLAFVGAVNTVFALAIVATNITVNALNNTLINVIT